MGRRSYKVEYEWFSHRESAFKKGNVEFHDKWVASRYAEYLRKSSQNINVQLIEVES